MKSEKQMRAEGRQIIRAIDNYQPLLQTRDEADAQSTLEDVKEA